MEMKGVIMRTHVVVLCSVVGFIGLVVVILGVASEAATAQALDPDVDYSNRVEGKCVYRATPALGCGLVAALLALTAQIVVTATSLCCGCCRTWEVPTEMRRIVGIILSAVSWIIVVIVVALFIAGAAVNTDHERLLKSADDACPVDPGGALFAAATVFSLVATGLQVASYVLIMATPKAGSTKPLAAQQLEMAMGQPAQQDAEEGVAGGGDPPPASVTTPPLSQATEPTSQV